jgi:hypothetical protein
MTKVDIVQFLRAQGFGKVSAALDAAIAYAEKNNPAPLAATTTVAKTEAATV